MRQLLLQQDDPNFKDIEDFLSWLEGKSTTPKEKCMKCEGWSEFLHLTPQRQNAFKAFFFFVANRWNFSNIKKGGKKGAGLSG